MSALENVLPEKAFRFGEKRLLFNLYELVSELEMMNDEDFGRYKGEHFDHFAHWIGTSVGEKQLALSLQKVQGKNEYVKTIQRFIEEQEHHQHAFSFAGRGTIIVLVLVFLLVLGMEQVLLIHKVTNTLDDTKGVTEFLKTLQQQNAALKESNILLRAENLELHYNNSVLQEQVGFLFPGVKGPQQRISAKHVLVIDDRVVISLPHPTLAIFPGSSSMLPVFTQTSYAIEIQPRSTDDVHAGDIISFHLDQALIAHRIIEIGQDGEGWYAITKGDHNLEADTEKVRWQQVENVVVGILY